MTEGDVHLGLDARGQTNINKAFHAASGVKKHWFKGKHPVGNVGIQMHHVDALRAGETVWTAGVQEVISIGALFNSGKYDASRVVALSGEQLTETGYTNTYLGASVAELTEGKVEGEAVRLVSGDLLSGSDVSEDGFLGAFDGLVSTVEEGNYHEMFGWFADQS